MLFIKTALIFCCCFIAAAWPKPPVPVFLTAGENLNFPAPPGSTAWLSTGQVISIKERNEQFIIRAKKIGSVLLKINNKAYQIQVISPAHKKKYQIVQEFLNSRKGLKAIFLKEKIHIIGFLYRLKDFKDLSRLSQIHNIDYVFSAQIPKNIRQALTYFLKKKIPLENPKLHISWEEQDLTVLVSDQSSYGDFYQKNLKSGGVTVKKDPSLLVPGQAIELKLLLVETSHDHSLKVHLDWGTGFMNRLIKPELFKEVVNSLQVMEQKGQAHILSQAVLLTESGKNLSFHAGGEVPIPDFHPETGQGNIKWKPYGIQLNFKPKLDWKKNIHIQTKAEISEVDHSYSVNDSPALKNSSINTSLTLKNGQTLALSTLVRKQGGKSFSAPWPLMRLPIAGSFISQKGKIAGWTRLSIFVTAQIKESQ